MAGPGQVVIIDQLEQLFDVFRIKTTDVIAIVDIAGRRADHHLGGETLGALDRRQQADHGADRVPDENHLAFRIEFDNLKHVFGVAVQVGVFIAVVRRQVGTTVAGQVEQDDLVTPAIRWVDETPHGLVAAIAMNEHDRVFPIAVTMDIVALLHRHDYLLESNSQYTVKVRTIVTKR